MFTSNHRYVNGDVTFRPEKIVEYSFVRDNDLQLFCEQVNNRIKEGWQPLGWVFESITYPYTQIMVKYQEHTSQSTGPK